MPEATKLDPRAAELKLAIDNNDVDRVRSLMTRDPALHSAPLGYGGSGPLTWVAECRVPREAPSPARLEMAEWMIDNGSDVHQGGDAPLMRAALADERVPMMKLLVRNDADVNARWAGWFPVLFAPCEAVAPAALKWLLDHGADPNGRSGGAGRADTALDYLIAGYHRSSRLAECIDLLRDAAGTTRYEIPAVIAILRGQVDEVAEFVRTDRSLLTRRFPELDFGATGGRRLTLKGATLLHVAAEYGEVESARVVLDNGADVNAAAEIDENGVGGQTALFHAATQFNDWGLGVAELLLHRGAKLDVRAKLPGHYEREDEFVECTPLEYSRLFPGEPTGSETTRLLLRQAG